MKASARGDASLVDRVRERIEDHKTELRSESAKQTKSFEGAKERARLRGFDVNEFEGVVSRHRPNLEAPEAEMLRGVIVRLEGKIQKAESLAEKKEPLARLLQGLEILGDKASPTSELQAAYLIETAISANARIRNPVVRAILDGISLQDLHNACLERSQEKQAQRGT